MYLHLHTAGKGCRVASMGICVGVCMGGASPPSSVKQLNRFAGQCGHFYGIHCVVPGAPHPRCPIVQAGVDVGGRDGGQRPWSGRGERGRVRSHRPCKGPCSAWCAARTVSRCLPPLCTTHALLTLYSAAGGTCYASSPLSLQGLQGAFGVPFTSLQCPSLHVAIAGMDLVRLTLERCHSARDGVNVLTALLVR